MCTQLEDNQPTNKNNNNNHHKNVLSFVYGVCVCVFSVVSKNNNCYNNIQARASSVENSTPMS